jgi:hypothetical protein
MAGMPHRIVHEDGYTMCGTLDQNGLTERMPNMAQGTATIYFGDRPGLEQQLQRQREQLKHYLNNIIAKTTAYAKAHPDNTADMNWAQRSFKRNVAFAAGVARGEIHFVHSTAVSVVHIFKAIGEAIYLDTRESIDTLSGDQQDYQHTSARLSAQGRAMIAPIKKAMALFELLSQDQTTRDILINFAAQYYQSDTPIMLSEQAGELVGGFIPAIIIAAITGNPELVPAQIAGEAGADITGAATEANDIAKTLEAMKKTKTIEQAQVDRLHVLVKEKSDAELVQSAKDIQSNSGYNTDEFNVVTLKKGSYLYGGLPGQTEFYTDGASIRSVNLA